MILLTIMLIAIIAFAVIGLFAAIVAGGSFLLWFGDIIVFSLIVWGVIKLIKRLKKK